MNIQQIIHLETTAAVYTHLIQNYSGFNPGSTHIQRWVNFINSHPEMG